MINETARIMQEKTINEIANILLQAKLETMYPGFLEPRTDQRIRDIVTKYDDPRRMPVDELKRAVEIIADNWRKT